MRASIKIPLTCKFRAGWNDQGTGVSADGKAGRRQWLAAIALHPRTREQGYSGSPTGPGSPS
ncbi:MAG: tRNA-dihydrouridine synthase [Paludibaculum sp.]